MAGKVFLWKQRLISERYTRIKSAVFYKLFWCEKVGNFSFTNNGEWETLTSRPLGEQSKFYTEAPTVFNHPEFGELRTVEISGEPWFVGKDVAVALGYSDTTQAIRKNISDEDKMTRPGDAPSIIDSFGRTQHPVWINESGLYSLILSSKLPSAKDFKHWVTAEVWKTGA